ncbi:hypothetical protein N7497_006991 [Penicillium chrysogenum]|nr:hypothetical protein N7497_006991 [Penicillium chrysogenum]
MRSGIILVLNANRERLLKKNSRLPSCVVTRIFSRLKHVQLEAEKIAETLEKDEEENGNQFLVLLKISPPYLRATIRGP